MDQRRSALARIAVRDLFHGHSKRGASLICLATGITESTIFSKVITTQIDIAFDRLDGSGSYGDDNPCRIDSVEPVPADIRDVLMSLERRFARGKEMAIRGQVNLGPDPLTRPQIDALVFIDDFYAAHMLPGSGIALMIDTTIAAIDAWMADNRQRLLDELLGFIAKPSVSTDPAYKPGMDAAAALLAERLGRIGMRNVQRLNAGGHDAVYADWLGAPGAPTILVYGHYDVQPPDPLEAWETPPFEPTIKDGRIHARGASDDKSPLWIAVSAMEAWLAVEGRLPVNVRLLLEGEEEVGSRSLPVIMARDKALLAADVLISADGGRWRPGTPTINTNSRGNIGCEITVRTADTDLHSGRYGGPVGNAAMVLSRLMASLHDAEGRIAVPGFLDGLKRPSNADFASMHALGFDEAKFFADIGARPGAIEPGVELLESLWLRPTIEVNGLWGGYQGPGGKTVIPREAHAKLTCRLGPGQDPGRCMDLLEAHLKRHIPGWADLSVNRSRGGTAAYVVPDEDPFLLAVEGVIAEVHGRKPLRVGVGGTLPISAMVKEALGLETVMLSYAIADERIHAPNEFFRLESLDDGLKAWPRALAAFGSVRR